MTAAVPAKCQKCGWTGLRGLDRVDVRVAALWESSGVEPPLINACRECKVGEVVDIEGPTEFENAVKAHLARQLVAAFGPGVTVRLAVVVHEKRGRVDLRADVPGRPWVEFPVTAAQVDSANFRQILDRIATAMHRELTRELAPEELNRPSAPFEERHELTAGHVAIEPRPGVVPFTVHPVAPGTIVLPPEPAVRRGPRMFIVTDPKDPS